MKRTHNAYIISLIVLNILIDQVSKIIVRANITFREEIQLIGELFILTNVENKGAFLGMGSDLSPTLRVLLLLFLPVVVLGLVTYYVFKEKTIDKWITTAFTFIIGGGIANVFDRFAYGSVTDFLHIDFGGVFKTGIFNIADVSVTTGMIMLLVSNFATKKHLKKEN